jgi:hypothetical protein
VFAPRVPFVVGRYRMGIRVLGQTAARDQGPDDEGEGQCRATQTVRAHRPAPVAALNSAI